MAPTTIIQGLLGDRQREKSGPSQPAEARGSTQYYNELLRFCNMSVRDLDAARDVLQEAYQRLLNLERSGTAIVHPKALMQQIIRRLVIDLHRREKVRSHLDIDALSEDEEPLAPAHLQPEEWLASMQVFRAYIATIEALPPRCREAFILHVFDEMPYTRIAEAMAISTSMVEKHIVRAMVACKQCERDLEAASRGARG